MSEVTTETTLRLYGSADAVVELHDNWEGMGLVSIRIGCTDAEEGEAWAMEPAALGWDMVRALGARLTAMAEAHGSDE